ncbi:MAG: fumarylacetoacetate hydrolase family protein [Anaerolineae bacterium]|nr:fumarylacetoacetate hydrolase family protein [Anaerolineae bacterium]
MIFLTFQTPEGLRLGAKTEQGIVDLKAAAPGGPGGFFRQPMTAEAKERIAQAIEAAARAGRFLDEAALTLGPCVPDPGKIICVGRNYKGHAEETGAPLPTSPILFSKFNNAIAAPGEPVPLPAGAEQFDYEVELAVVIGRRAKHVPETAALDYVFGYCNANDISARDLQFLTPQWLLGKTPDKFFPIGPYLFTADEIGDPQNLPVRCWLNGELRQNSNTAQMIFSVAHLVGYASQYMTLEPGDIISTGTPDGVILGRADKIWMKPGDEVTVEVGPLGKLTNKMVAES